MRFGFDLIVVVGLLQGSIALDFRQRFIVLLFAKLRVSDHKATLRLDDAVTTAHKQRQTGGSVTMEVRRLLCVAMVHYYIMLRLGIKQGAGWLRKGNAIFKNIAISQ